jgi:hypothetical protein
MACANNDNGLIIEALDLLISGGGHGSGTRISGVGNNENTKISCFVALFFCLLQEGIDLLSKDTRALFIKLSGVNGGSFYLRDCRTGEKQNKEEKTNKLFSHFLDNFSSRVGVYSKYRADDKKKSKIVRNS